MGKKFDEGQGQIVHWWQSVRCGKSMSGRELGVILRKDRHMTMTLSGFAPLEAVDRDSSRES